MNERSLEVLGALFEVAPPILAREFSRDICILGTRIAIEALDAFGVKARPQSVGVLTFNAEAQRLLEGGMTQEELAEVMRPIPKAQPGGPWVMGVDASLKGPDPTRYNGHLVAIVQGPVLVDLTIEQVNRPHKNIVTEPLAIELGEVWERDGTAWTLFEETGTLVVYQRRDGETLWQQAVDWRWPTRGTDGYPRRALYRAVVGEIVREMRQHVAVAS